MKGSTVIEGTLNSTPNTAFKIQFFSSDAHDPSGFGEGRTFIRSTTVVTGGACHASFTVSLPATEPSGRFFTATATNPNHSTSEFSKAIPVLCLSPLSPLSASFASMGGEGSITITSNCCGIGSGHMTYTVAPKASGSGRTGGITVAGKTFNVKQQ